MKPRALGTSSRQGPRSFPNGAHHKRDDFALILASPERGCWTEQGKQFRLVKPNPPEPSRVMTASNVQVAALEKRGTP
jgi:hypothetical protein